MTKHKHKTPGAQDGPERGIAEQAQQALCDLNRILDGNESTGDVGMVVDNDPSVIRVPRALAAAIRTVLANAAAGQGVTVIPAHAEFTTQQAADMLNVSRPYLIKLVEEGAIGYRMVGTHRRILASSLHEYQQRMELETRNAADELTQLTEDMGLYS